MSSYFLSSWFNSLLSTNPFESTGRIKTDTQQTSFEENRQFRFFEDLSVQDYKDPVVDNSVPANTVLVYKFTATNPVNIQKRLLNGWAGGRKYLVFPADGNEIITGGKFDDVSNLISVMNNNLAPQNDIHPASGVTVEKRIATSFKSTTDTRTGVAYKAGSNQNQATAAYSPGGSRAGVGAGSVFYLVLTDLSTQSDDSKLLFEVQWEEIFN